MPTTKKKEESVSEINSRTPSASSSSRGPANGSSSRNSARTPRKTNGDSQYYKGETISIKGTLEILPDFGVIRQEAQADENLPKDVYISQSQIRRFNLRKSDLITGQSRPPKEGERYLSLLKIETVDGMTPEQAKTLVQFKQDKRETGSKIALWDW